jgi:hypothetical protein
LTDPTVLHQASQFDPTRLLALRARAELVFRNPRQDPDRYKTAAAVLCAFYRALDEDDAFWDAVAGLVGDPDVRRILDVPADFEDQEYDLLLRAGVEPLTAVALAADLKSEMDRYQPASVPEVQTIRAAVRQLGAAVCAAENDLDGAKTAPQRSRLKLLGRALDVAGAIVSIGLNVSVALLISAVAGLIVVARNTVEYVAERPNDG